MKNVTNDQEPKARLVDAIQDLSQSHIRMNTKRWCLVESVAFWEPPYITLGSRILVGGYEQHPE